MTDEKNNNVGGYSRFKKYAIIGLFTGLSLTISSGLGLGKIAGRFGSYIEQKIPPEISKQIDEETEYPAELETPPKQLEQLLAQLAPEQRKRVLARAVFYAAQNDELNSKGAYSAAIMFFKSYQRQTNKEGDTPWD